MKQQNQNKSGSESKESAVKINHVFVSSWGYEQTNISFYQVVGLQGKKTVILREISSITEYNSSTMSGLKSPDLNKFISEPFKKRVNDYFGRAGVKIDDFAYAYLQDREKYIFSCYA